MRGGGLLVINKALLMCKAVLIYFAKVEQGHIITNRYSKKVLFIGFIMNHRCFVQLFYWTNF